MAREIRTAVAAAASHTSRMQIIHGLAKAGIRLDYMGDDGLAALHALGNFRSDLLVADIALPGMDGISLAKRILCSLSLPVRPAVILMQDAHFPPPDGDLLQHCGAVFLDVPVLPEGFSKAVNCLRNTEVHFTDSEQKRTDELLNDLGVPVHTGRECLKQAILFCAADQRFRHHLGARLYPKVGTVCGLNACQAERAMRHVIDLAWQSDKFDNQYRIFADTVDAGRGQPTCSEMILRLADILRSEG